MITPSLTSTHHHAKAGFSLQRIHIDGKLLGYLLLLIAAGSIILYSASNQNPAMMIRQFMRLSIAFSALFIFAQIPPHKYQAWTPWLYTIGLSLLIAVMLIGKIGKGAQRWLDLGFIRFQPSELMKLAVPMMVAWYLSNKPLPASKKSLAIACLIIFIPAALIAKQPDLGTALIVSFAGICVVFLSGISFRILFGIIAMTLLASPVLWHYLHDYQKQRVLTLLNPESDPLGTGYHIIQSKIAIGSGGLLGKGWLNGSQSHLHFLPEHATDFIFAVCGEEFGLIGCLILIFIIALVLWRCMQIAISAQNCYTRLLAASLSLSFFISAFVNIGMVTGILPVVGIPLPLVSYGSTAMVTFLASFGVLMSISTHRNFFNDMTC